jgi:hypothetical protein
MQTGADMHGSVEAPHIVPSGLNDAPSQQTSSGSAQRWQRPDTHIRPPPHAGSVGQHDSWKLPQPVVGVESGTLASTCERSMPTGTHAPELPHVRPCSSQRSSIVHGTVSTVQPGAGAAHESERKMGNVLLT